LAFVAKRACVIGSGSFGTALANVLASNCEQVHVCVGGTHAGTAQPVLDAELYGHLQYPPMLVDLTVSRDDHPDLRIEGWVDGKQR